MKKVKLCIAGLLLTGMSYGQCIDHHKDSTIVIIEERMRWKVLDLIESIKIDIYYGKTDKNSGNYYIKRLEAILPSNDNWCKKCENTI